jgi:hypothetical protein
MQAADALFGSTGLIKRICDEHQTAFFPIIVAKRHFWKLAKLVRFAMASIPQPDLTPG